MSPQTHEKGELSIHTENIFPIIKKFLYSDQEVFLRELVSNAVDATQKLKRLIALGEYTEKTDKLQIEIILNPTAKTLTISDEGIGMSADEIKKYINQIAFSGAQAFIEKYKTQGEKEIIGHFGLGFYSAFMVAKKVDIHTRSYRKKEAAVRWTCEGGTSFELDKTVKKQRGTDVVLHIDDKASEFLDKTRIRHILDKYSKFLPVPIVFEGEIINTTEPAWVKSPASLTDKDYLAFYKTLYPYAPEPLFWIHLNVDYPFTLTGILYFPKPQGTLDLEKNKIQLYSRQVFITDEVQQIVPDFLRLLHGVMDSPDIPLNVSRSALQSDSNVKKIDSYITKKVADKLKELFEKDRPAYEKKWNDMAVFVKYGLFSDETFYEKAQDIALVENTQQEYFTLSEYKAKVQALQTNKKHHSIFLYTQNKQEQHSFIQQAQKRGYDVLNMEGTLDLHFIQHIEVKHQDIQWKRVDASPAASLIDAENTPEALLTQKEQDTLKEHFKKIIGKQEGIDIQLQALAPDDPPLSIVFAEHIRRMQDMTKQQAYALPTSPLGDMYSVIINGNHPLMPKLLQQPDKKRTLYLEQMYDLALLAQQKLSGQRLTALVERSFSLINP